MKIHSDKLLPNAFESACEAAGVELDDFEQCGSRSRKRAFKFSLTGSSNHNRGFGAPGKAATWDEWGIFLAYLFRIDPNAHCGKGSYESEEDFHWKTDNRFMFLSRRNQHKQHKWVPLGNHTSECECGATQRWRIIA